MCALYVRCALSVLQKECRKVWGARYTLGAHYRSENTLHSFMLQFSHIYSTVSCWEIRQLSFIFVSQFVCRILFYVELGLRLIEEEDAEKEEDTRWLKRASPIIPIISPIPIRPRPGMQIVKELTEVVSETI